MRALLTKPRKCSSSRRDLPASARIPGARTMALRTTALPFDRIASQRTPSCACGGGCPSCKGAVPSRAEVAVNQPGDMHGHHLAREGMRLAAPTQTAGGFVGDHSNGWEDDEANESVNVSIPPV